MASYQEANLFAESLRTRGFHGLIEAVWTELQKKLPNNKRHSIVTGLRKDRFEISCYEVLLTTDPRLLSAIVGGNLEKLYREDRAVGRLLDAHKSRGKLQPSIYMQLLSDKKGKSPSPNELLRVTRKIRQYLRDPVYALEVDERLSCAHSWSIADEREGLRRYLCDEGNPTVPVADRSGLLRMFCDALETRMLAFPSEDGDEPLAIPLVEFGYAADSEDRLKSHAKHRNSNFIMNLTESICMGLWGEDKYRMRQQIIYYIWNANHGFVAESLFTMIGRGYIYDGFGFSHHPAGQNNPSLLRITQGNWIMWQTDVYRRPLLKENLARVQEKSRPDREEVEALERNLVELSKKETELEWQRMVSEGSKRDVQDPAQEWEIYNTLMASSYWDIAERRLQEEIKVMREVLPAPIEDIEGVDGLDG